ncbi:MAG: transglutaminase-like domain-containing protein [Lachnospiraceae bacterium]
MFCLKRHRSCVSSIIIVTVSALVFSACGSDTTDSHVTVKTTVSASRETRSNKAVVLVPVTGSTAVYGNESITIDASYASEGYLTADYRGDNQKVKLQLTGSNEITYTYNLKNGSVCLPLTAGSGTYRVTVYENINGDQYATAYSDAFDLTIKNIMGPYLYPNQYVDFSKGSKTVELGEVLAENAANDLEVIGAVYEYVITNIDYDYDKAENVESGYLPNVDKILSEKRGICFDYAAVMAAMLRSQRIPTRLEIGYAGDAYHAWVSTYIKDIGWINGIIKFDGENWTLMDPTFAANSSEADLKDFIGDGSNYATKYVY